MTLKEYGACIDLIAKVRQVRRVRLRLARRFCRTLAWLRETGGSAFLLGQAEETAHAIWHGEIRASKAARRLVRQTYAG